MSIYYFGLKRTAMFASTRLLGRFKQKLVNIGQIITNESGNMELLLKKLRKAEQDGFFDLEKTENRKGFNEE